MTSASYDSSCSNPVTCNRPNTTTDESGNVTNYLDIGAATNFPFCYYRMRVP